ncbi:MAG: DUF3810 family protein [Trueperaceae bacterium]
MPRRSRHAASPPRGRCVGRPTRRSRIVPWALLAGLAAAWAALRMLPAGWIDGPWAAGVLPPLSAASAAWIDASPVSLTLVGAIAWLVVVAIVATRPTLARASRLAWALVLVTALGPTFELAWGLGYRRTPLEAQLALGAAAPTAEPTWAALDRLLEVAIVSAPTTSDAVALDTAWRDDAFAAAAACVAAADAFVLRRGAPLRLPERVRSLPAGLLLAGGFAGFQSPWWREPHLDGGLPPVAATSVALHELAHAAGWAREAETDALATLAGLACAEPDVRFAAALHALLLVRAELARVAGDDPAWRARLDAAWARLPAVAGEAWAASRAASERYRSTTAERAAAAVYDGYLRTQGVEAGIADYGRAGVLLLNALAACAEGASAPWCAQAASTSAAGGASR